MLRFLILVPFITNTVFAQSENRPTKEKIFMAGEILVSYRVKNKNKIKAPLIPEREIGKTLSILQGKTAKISPIHIDLIKEIKASGKPEQEILKTNIDFNLSKKLLIKFNKKTSIPLLIKKLKKSKSLSKLGINITSASPNYIVQKKPKVTTLTLARSIVSEIGSDSEVVTINAALPFLDDGYKEEIAAAESRGIILLAPAGDSNSKSKYYPASLDNVISIAGGLSNFELSPQSNFGNWINLAAPTDDDKKANSFLSTAKVKEILNELCKIEGKCNKESVLKRLMDATVPLKNFKGAKNTTIRILDNNQFLHSIKPPGPNFDAMDLNDDGYIDREDLVLLKSRLGMKVSAGEKGDINQDGIIDQNDYEFLLDEVRKREKAEVKGFNLKLNSNLLLNEEYNLQDLAQAYLTDGTILTLSSSEAVWLSANPEIVSIDNQKLLAKSVGKVNLAVSVNFQNVKDNLNLSITVHSSETFPEDQTASLKFNVKSEDSKFSRSCFPAEHYAATQAYTEKDGTNVPDGLLVIRKSSIQHANYSQEIINAKWSVKIPPLNYNDKLHVKSSGYVGLSNDKKTLWLKTYNCTENGSCINAIARVDIKDPSSPRFIDHTPDPNDKFYLPSVFTWDTDYNLTGDQMTWLDLDLYCTFDFYDCDDDSRIFNARISNGNIIYSEKPFKRRSVNHETGPYLHDWFIIDRFAINWPYALAVSAIGQRHDVALAKISESGSIEIERRLESFTTENRYYKKHFSGHITKSQTGIDYAIVHQKTYYGDIGEGTTQKREYRYSRRIRGNKSHTVTGETDFPYKIYEAPDGTILAIGKYTEAYTAEGSFKWKLNSSLYQPVFFDNGLIYANTQSTDTIYEFKDINPDYELKSKLQPLDSKTVSYDAWLDTTGSFLLPSYNQIKDTTTDDFTLQHKYIPNVVFETRAEDQMLPTTNHINLISSESNSCSQEVCKQ